MSNDVVSSTEEVMEDGFLERTRFNGVEMVDLDAKPDIVADAIDDVMESKSSRDGTIFIVYMYVLFSFGDWVVGWKKLRSTLFVL